MEETVCQIHLLQQLLGQERGNLLGDLGEILVPCADVE